MSKIVSTKRNKEGVVLELQTDYDEFLDLQGHMDQIHLFAEEKGLIKTHISQRGKNGATKYFLVPRQLRKGFKFDNAVSCQRIDKDDKAFFIYTIDKLKTNSSRREITISKFSD